MSENRRYHSRKKLKHPGMWTVGMLLAAGAVLLTVGLWSMRPPVAPHPIFSGNSTEPSQGSSLIDLEESAGSSSNAVTKLEPGNLYTGTLREQYKSGDMTLTIPRMDIWNVSVQNGTDDDTLTQGPGLFLYSQLPSQQDGNVSLAGHRDIHGALFYYLHTLSEGDYFYLNWNGMTYRYLYEKTYVVTPDDWGPIKTQGYSCLTLLSCDPIGTSRNRIIVAARLEDSAKQNIDYDYKPWMDGMDKPFAWEKDAVSYDKTENADPTDAG